MNDFRPMDAQTKRRLISNIVSALNKNNQLLLTFPSIRWLIANYWLRPEGLWELNRENRTRFSKADKELFNRNFNLFHYIESDVDLNHALCWIIHWYKQKDYLDQTGKIWGEFRQRIEIVHEIRMLIGLKNYNLRIEKHEWNGKFKKHFITLRARNTQELLTIFRHSWKNSQFITYVLKKVKELKYFPHFMIRKDIPEPIFKALT